MEDKYLAKRRLKRKIIIFFVFISIFLLLSYGAMAIFSYFSSRDQNEDYHTTYLFYPSDYEADIFEDPEYLGLNRYITVVNGPVSTTITDNDYAAYGDVVVFLAEKYISSIIAGDAETYNLCFSEEYYTENQPMDRFTMQQLYNISFIFQDEELKENGEAEYNTYAYRVEYMIHRNNGTFRRDMDSDSIRPQYLIISDREGELKIDRIVTP